MQHEEESVELVKQLKPTEAALLNWAVGLMADVVEEEDSYKDCWEYCNGLCSKHDSGIFP